MSVVKTLFQSRASCRADEVHFAQRQVLVARARSGALGRMSDATRRRCHRTPGVRGKQARHEAGTTGRAEGRGGVANLAKPVERMASFFRCSAHAANRRDHRGTKRPVQLATMKSGCSAWSWGGSDSGCRAFAVITATASAPPIASSRKAWRRARAMRAAMTWRGSSDGHLMGAGGRVGLLCRRCW